MRCLCVCPLQLWNHLTDFNEIWYGCYAVGDHLDLVLLNSLVSKNNTAIVGLRTCEVEA
jgi:hypothetical protein